MLKKFSSITFRRIITSLYSFFISLRFKKCGTKFSLGYPSTIPFFKSIEIGNSVKIREHSWINCEKSLNDKVTLKIGNGSYIGRFIHLNAKESVIIEQDVLISDRVYISDHNHEFLKREPIKNQPLTKPKAVRLKSGCWIGIGAVISPGVTIGKNAVVGANAVVTRDVPDATVVAGVPARVLIEK